VREKGDKSVSEKRKSYYLISTRNEIGKMYDELSSTIKTVLQQPSIIVRPRKIKSLMLILDEGLIKSKSFHDLIYDVGRESERIVGVYIPEEEYIIARLRDLGLALGS
jgi:hypothetical protein